MFLVTLCNTIILGSLEQQSNPVGGISSRIRERKTIWGKKNKSYSPVNHISPPSIRIPDIRVINTQGSKKQTNEQKTHGVVALTGMEIKG